MPVAIVFHNAYVAIVGAKCQSARLKYMVNQVGKVGAALEKALYQRTDEQEGRFATRLSVPQHFGGQGWRLQ